MEDRNRQSEEERAAGAKRDDASRVSVAQSAIHPQAQQGTPAAIQHTKLELPKGGGAIRGIGETFEVNAVTGTGSISVPLPITPGRGGFSPQLALSYNSGGGNSPFGLGWDMGVPSISRKTDKRLPTYRDGC
jgi:hypothetical protein